MNLLVLLSAMLSTTALAAAPLPAWLTPDPFALSQMARTPLRHEPVFFNGAPLKLQDLKFNYDESRKVFSPELPVDPEQVQSLYQFDEKSFVEESGADDFLDAKWKLYRGIRYDFKLKSYLPETARLSDWMGLVHPPLRRLAQPLSFYSKKAAQSPPEKTERQTPQFQKKLDLLSASELTSGNSVRFVNNGDVTASRLTIARQATRTLWGGALLMVCDAGTQELIDLLAEKVKQGVDVRIMLDQFMQSMQKGNCVETLKNLGVKVLLVKGMISHWSAFHMKMWIADLTAAQIEGMNMIEAQTLATGFNHLYRDSGLSFEGPLVTDTYGKYIELWNHYSKNKIPPAFGEILEKRRADETQSRKRGNENYPTWLNHPEGALCRLVTQDRKTDSDRISPAYSELLRTVQDSIIITSVRRGFGIGVDLGRGWHQKLLNQLIRKSTEEGVRVDLMVNSDQNVFSAWDIPSAGLNAGERLNPVTRAMRFQRRHSSEKSLWQGSKFFEEIAEKSNLFRAWSYMDFSHMKVALLDRDTFIAGSYNPFTVRSNRDAELVVICQDAKLAGEANRQLVLDLTNSTPFPFRSQQ